MKKPLWLLLLPALLAGAYFHLNKPEPVTVTTATVSTGRVEDIVTNTRAGTLKACRRARLSLATGGQIASLPVRKGERVEKGRLLVELWNRDRRASLALARAREKVAHARAREQCAPVVAAYRELVRLQRLVKEKAASRRQLDQARAEADSRQAACEAAQAELRVAQARVEAAEAALEQTRLLAPFAGIVAEINGELNEYVTPSPVGVATLPVIDLLDPGCLYASAPIDEVEAPRLETGLPARIHIDAFSGRPFPGHVRRIAPYVQEREKQARTVEVEVDFDTLPEKVTLLPGYTTDVEILVAAHDAALRIPTEALVDGRHVLVVNGNGRLERRRVRTGLSNWEWTEVLDGLAAGEQVVLEVERRDLVPGMPVRARPREDAAR